MIRQYGRWAWGGTLIAGLAVAGGGTPATIALAADGLLPPERKQYSSLDAGADAYRMNEARRSAEIGNQLGLNNRLRWQSWYGSLVPGVFEAWPMVPGDIWGYPIVSPIRQSVGQRSYQAAPNRWISEPVYEEDLAPPLAPLGPVAPTVPPAANVPPVAAVPPLLRPPARRAPEAAGQRAPSPLPPKVRPPVELPHPRPEPSDSRPTPGPGPREF